MSSTATPVKQRRIDDDDNVDGNNGPSPVKQRRIDQCFMSANKFKKVMEAEEKAAAVAEVKAKEKEKEALKKIKLWEAKHQPCRVCEWLSEAEQAREMYKHRKCGLWCRLKQPRESK